ncbi:Insulinase (Peptidase family M16) [seawater metagenome]|uniref:Insulinase (Peptidase family M16) n=1 Tax=seawater metagenome TaxID=1561972 RepID=A0A5E8CIY1_9ZZZZ
MTKKKKNSLEIIQGNMSNGMQVMILPTPDSELVSVGMFVKAGVKYENRKNNGISHFLEHMMYQGTSRRNGVKIANDLDKVGANYNAATSYEFTFYDIIGQIKDIDLFLEIIIDIFYNSSLNNKEINREKKIVLEEMRMYKDDKRAVLEDIYHEKMYKGKSLAMPILGTETNVMNFTKKDLVDYKKKFYRNDNSVLVVIGNVKLKTISTKLDLLFNKFSKEIDEICLPNKIKSYTQERPYLSINYDNNMEQTLVKIVFRTFGRNYPYSEALQILEEILSSGSSSRLFHLLRNKLAATYFNFVENDQYEDAGSFIITLGVDPKQVTKVIKAILVEIKRLKTKKILKSELTKIENIRKTNEILRNESSVQDSLFSYGIDALFADGFNNQVTNLRPTDIVNVAKVIFSPENLSIFILGPFNQKEEVVDIMDKFR